MDIIHISFNNWFCGRDYPIGEPFETWLSYHSMNFSNDEWCKKNKLCVYAGNIDMSRNYTITAPRDWVEKNCPQLLTDEEYEYKVIVYQNKKSKEIIEKKKYSDFVVQPDEYGHYYDRFDWPFLDYCEENFGVHYYSEDYDEDEDDGLDQYWDDGCPIEDSEV